MLSAIEDGEFSEAELVRLRKQWQLGAFESRGHDQEPRVTRISESRVPSPESHLCPVLGITGTGGAGKPPVVDELVLRFLHACPEAHIAGLAIGPTRRRSRGAMPGHRL